MSCAIVTVIYGVPLTEEVSKKIREWESENDERWTDDGDYQCGFETLYSASGGDLLGFCGIQIGELEPYGNQKVSDVCMEPTTNQMTMALQRVERLDPELRKLAGEPSIYFIWHDS